MSRRRLLLILRFAIFVSTVAWCPRVVADDAVMRICMQDKRWFPISYLENGRPVGLAVDLLDAVFAKLGLKYELVPLPWKRCVEHAASLGEVDAVLSAGWTKERAAYLNYPGDAQETGDKPGCRSRFAMLCLAASMIVLRESPYVFSGDLSHVPEPLFINWGSRQVEEFKARHVVVETGPDDMTLVRMLLRQGKGSVLTLALMEPVILEAQEFRSRVRAVPGFFRSGDSHLAFTKTSRIPPKTREAIWRDFEARAKDASYMRGLVARYLGNQPLTH